LLLVAGGILISINDTTILTALSRYPHIPVAEQDEYINQIEHEENIPLCLAVVGRLSPDELTPSARQTYEEFTRWSIDRTRRIRNEQMSDRYRRKENRTAIKMAQLREQGVISEETLMLYGMSGDLPDRRVYRAMSDEEKRAIWEERMERSFGPNWRDHVAHVPPLLQKRSVEFEIHNWSKEGF
jgi:hypothetical protein